MIFSYRLGIGCALALSCIVQGHSLELSGDLDLIAGYRNDRITTSIQAFDPPETRILKDTLKAKNINIWDVGVYGRLEICYDTFLRGFAHFGRVENGRYTETVQTALGSAAVSRAKIYKGNTRDFSIGAGYFFRWDDFKMGPAAGWAYDFQRIKMKDGRTEGIANPILNGLVYQMRWQGPWVGLEAEWVFCNFKLRPGYEYHWTHWKAKWQLAGPDIIGGAFSDRRTSNRVYGNVVFIDGWYTFWCGFDLGLGFKYQFWNAIRGKEKPNAGSFSAVGLSNTEVDRVHRATWRSFEVHLSLGYSF